MSALRRSLLARSLVRVFLLQVARQTGCCIFPKQLRRQPPSGLGCQWPWNEVSMFSKLFPPPPSFLRGVWSGGQPQDTAESPWLQASAQTQTLEGGIWIIPLFGLPPADQTNLPLITARFHRNADETLVNDIPVSRCFGSDVRLCWGFSFTFIILLLRTLSGEPRCGLEK